MEKEKKSILVVDDDKDILESLKTIFSQKATELTQQILGEKP